jgi:O6-methylguanine-DNA--protein-cysteine methyltransferase
MGKIREYNGEVYVAPEVVRKVGANWETLRLLELKKAWKEQRGLVQKVRELQKHTSDLNELKALAAKEGLDADLVQAVLEAQELKIFEQEKQVEATNETRDKVLKLVEKLDTGEGADYDQLLKQSGFPEAQLDAAVNELLESGVCFEPKAGRIKKL